MNLMEFMEKFFPNIDFVFADIVYPPPMSRCLILFATIPCSNI